LFVYILYSERRNRFYTGQTQDVTHRLYRHNAGLEKSTKTGRPWKLVWSTAVENRSQAAILEKKIKSRGAQRFLGDLGV